MLGAKKKKVFWLSLHQEIPHSNSQLGGGREPAQLFPADINLISETGGHPADVLPGAQSEGAAPLLPQSLHQPHSAALPGSGLGPGSDRTEPL